MGAQAVIKPMAASLRVLLWNLQSLPTPDELHITCDGFTTPLFQKHQDSTITAPEPYIVNFINIKYENNSFDKITTSKINFNLFEIFDGSIPFKSLITRAEAIVSI